MFKFDRVNYNECPRILKIFVEFILNSLNLKKESLTYNLVFHLLKFGRFVGKILNKTYFSRTKKVQTLVLQKRPIDV